MERRQAIRLTLLGTAGLALVEAACGSIYDRNFETTIADIAADPKRFSDWHGYVKITGYPVLTKEDTNLDVQGYFIVFPIVEEKTTRYYELYQDEKKEGPKILMKDWEGNVYFYLKEQERKGKQGPITIIGEIGQDWVPGQKDRAYMLYPERVKLS